MNKAIAAIIFVVTSAPSWAQMTPEGLWRNVDDKTGEAKAEIRIQANGAGVLNGTIEKRLTKDAKPEDVCKECDDDRKDKPLLGLEIIRGAKKAEGKDVWEAARFSTPRTAATTRCALRPPRAARSSKCVAPLGRLAARRPGPGCSKGTGLACAERGRAINKERKPCPDFK